MRCSEPEFGFFNFEISSAEFLENPFQVRHRRIAIDGQTFYLVKHRRMGLVVVAAVDPSRGNDPDRRSAFLHGANLHGRGMRSKHVRLTRVAFFLDQEEGVVLLPCRMVRMHIQGVEIVPVRLDLRTFGDLESQIREYRRDFFGYLANGWIVPFRLGRPGKVTSIHSVRSFSSSAASENAAFFAANADATSFFSAFSAVPAFLRSPLSNSTSRRSIKLISPFLPRAETRTFSSSDSSSAAPTNRKYFRLRSSTEFIYGQPLPIFARLPACRSGEFSEPVDSPCAFGGLSGRAGCAYANAVLAFRRSRRTLPVP